MLRLLLAAFLLLPTAAMAEGMPQLNFANPLTSTQAIWLAVIFAVLYVVMGRFALPKVGSVLEERATHIAHDLESAMAAKNRADTAVAEMAEATAKARAEAQAAINAAVTEAKQAAARQAAELNERLERQLAEAETQIDAARSAAMGALRQVATDTAAVVVSRLISAAPDTERLNQAVDRALAARGVG